VATISDLIKHTRGLRSNLPILDDGRIAIIEDSGEERLVFGTVSGNVDVPSQLDLSVMNTTISDAVTNMTTLANTNFTQAINTANDAKTASDLANSNYVQTLNTASTANDTANLANSTASTANDTANSANSIANTALNTANSTEAQVANIIANNGNGTVPTELVDMRTDSSGTIWVSSGEHIRNLDKINSILKPIQIFTATVDNTSIIPIDPSILSQVDITKIALDVYDLGSLIKLGDNYTIDTVANTIVLNGWSLANGETIEYRVYK